MQSNLFDDLKSLKTKMTQDEKRLQEEKSEQIKKEKEKVLQDQFALFMKESGVKKIH